jgi:hypothetical protein
MIKMEKRPRTASLFFAKPGEEEDEAGSLIIE